MKKCLTLLIAVALSLMSFASVVPKWDEPLKVESKPVKVFTDPYVSNFDAWESGSGAYKNLVLYVAMGQAASYYYKVTLSVYGNWHDIGYGSKLFDVILNPGQVYRYEYIPIEYNDYIYSYGLTLEYYGPA
jgi:hypothetical protein